MPSLRQVGRLWHIRFQSKQRTPPEVVIRLKVEAYTLAQARAYMKALDVDYSRGVRDPWKIAAGETPASDALTLQQALDNYVADRLAAGRSRERGGWKQPTADDRTVCLTPFVRLTGPATPAAAVTLAHQLAWLSEGGIEDYTRHKRRMMLVAWANWLRGKGLADWPRPAPVKVRKKLPPYVTEAELDDLCAELDVLHAEKLAKPNTARSIPSRAWMADVFRVAFYQGMRRGELMALRVGAVRFEEGVILVGDDVAASKTEQANYIPLVPPARPILARLCEGRPHDARVFGRSDGRKVSNAFKEVVARKLPAKAHLHFHHLRHSCAVYWRHRGVPFEDIRDLLRHESITTTEVYDQISREDLVERFAVASRRARRKIEGKPGADSSSQAKTKTGLAAKRRAALSQR